eukprot:CAMPEP_0201578520 /NCGR_PEP_ID=MMETSP0190_2-20130828/25420_1 /ASSEMBLY_ACC=CAM_ASM_000263 /TAXON_ID=37353 /ORGANISM="Rosalina sp." /LENGTH=169 /DNA_ID=CAMNT_0048011789 /DNA_START=110 /DNA_END=619 /DNA_ORIENTATION=+
MSRSNINHNDQDINVNEESQNSSQMAGDEMKSQMVGLYVIGSMIIVMLTIITLVCVCRYCRRKRRDERLRNIQSKHLRLKYSNSNSKSDSSSLSPKDYAKSIEGSPDNISNNNRCYNQVMNLNTIYEDRTLSGTEWDVDSDVKELKKNEETYNDSMEDIVISPMQQYSH